MFTINNINNEGKRPTERQDVSMDQTMRHDAVPHATNVDATQRIDMNRTAPVRRAPAAYPRRRQPAKQKWKLDQRTKKIIALSAIAAAILIAIIITCSIIFAEPADDGLILKNVYAAGVNLGGKTPEEASQLLLDATQNTYSKIPLTVTVQDTELALNPADTNASLNIEGVVQAAYNYGRTGTRAERQAARLQSLTSSHVISVLPYLHINTGYIQSQVNELGNIYSSVLTQTSYRLEGTKPDLNMPSQNIDTSKAYQTLYITMGTPEYVLDSENLYEQILDAYNTNIFQVTGAVTVVSPDQLDLDELFEQLCVAPVNAQLDESTYDITEGKYGYGFLLDQAKMQLSDTKYGETLEIPMTFIRPDVTAKDLNDGLFETKLAVLNLSLSSASAEQINNIKVACRALGGTKGSLILRSNSVFSWDEVIGKPTTSEGYKTATAYSGRNQKSVLGGGISHLASALYYCALKSDMAILERSSHTFLPSFIEAGFDAYVEYGIANLQFRNTTGNPVRIEASVSGSTLQVCIWGTASTKYTISLTSEKAKVYQPNVMANIMRPSNPGGYKDGDVLVEGITGYDIVTCRVYRYVDSKIDPYIEIIANTHYEKQNKVVVELQEEIVETPDNPDVPADGPSDDPTDDPNDDPTDGPSDGPVDNPTDNPDNNPDNDPTDNPKGDAGDDPADGPTDDPDNNQTSDSNGNEVTT